MGVLLPLITSLLRYWALCMIVPLLSIQGQNAFFKNIEGLMGLERHLMTEFSFLGELSL